MNMKNENGRETSRPGQRFFAAGTVLLVHLVRLGPEGLKFWPVDSGQTGKY